MKFWTTVISSEEVTDEILSAAEGIFDGWFAEAPSIDWTDFLDRLDGMTLDNGTLLDLEGGMSSPAINKIKAHIRAYRNS